MKALCWEGIGRVQVDTVPDPKILNPRDAIVKITSTAICGSDLHLLDGYIPTMKSGDILGHEFMGEVVEVGREVRNLRPGDRVVVPFTISCGGCFFCKSSLFSLCDNSNPNAWIAEAAYGCSPAGIYGYSHMLGGYAGGQAEYARVPYADVGPIKIDGELGLTDDQVLFLSDILPTGYMAAENCSIQAGDTIGVWGCGPVGQFAIRSAFLLGAEKVIAIDRYPSRLQKAREAGAQTIDFSQEDVYETILEQTGGRGPDGCIDAVGLEAHGTGSFDATYDRVKAALWLTTDRIHVLRQMIQCARKGGSLSVPGVYGGLPDKFPMGALFNKGLVLRGGQTHVQRYLRPLLDRIAEGAIDPTTIISHRLPLERAAEAYHLFRDNPDECLKVVLKT